MLDFLLHKKRDEVKRVLHGRVNRAQARSITAQSSRSGTRGAVAEVVWVIPCSSASSANYSHVFPAVCKDICSDGIGILHNAAITEPCAIIGLSRDCPTPASQRADGGESPLEFDAQAGSPQPVGTRPLCFTASVNLPRRMIPQPSCQIIQTSPDAPTAC
jgi:hypothetical protein